MNVVLNNSSNNFIVLLPGRKPHWDSLVAANVSQNDAIIFKTYFSIR